MNHIIRQKLREILTRFGVETVKDPKRMQGLLRDDCGEQRREVNVLIAVLQEGVPGELLAHDPRLPEKAMAERLIKRLEDNLSITRASARWAVETWAVALGKDGLLGAGSGGQPAAGVAGDRMVVTLAAGVEMELVHVAAGKFWMGSCAAGRGSVMRGM